MTEEMFDRYYERYRQFRKEKNEDATKKED